MAVSAGKAVVQEVNSTPLTADQPYGPPSSPQSHPLTGNSNPRSLSLGGPRTSSEVVAQLRKTHSTLSLRQRAVQTKETDEIILTVGISGCSSSGKTTSTLILAEIFTRDDMSAPAAVPTNDSTELKNQNLVIQEDKFFHNKGACTSASFKTTPEDAEFCMQSCVSDESNEYIIRTLPTLNVSPDVEQHSPPSTPTHHRDLSDTSFNSESTVVEIEQFRIFGPDTDSVPAINFEELLHAVQHVRNTGTLAAPLDPQLAEAAGFPRIDRAVSIDPQVLREEHDVLIKMMKKEVAVWVKQQCIKNAECGFEGQVVKFPGHTVFDDPAINVKFCFIEGFLLFSGPIADDDKANDEDIQDGKILADIVKRFGDVQVSEEQIELMEIYNVEKSIRLKKDLMSMMDVKLFLLTSKDTARTRRQDRKEYLDHPHGTRRPGQMWKTRGYFEHIAWPNYLRDHAFLIDEKGNVRSKAVTDVQVRDQIDAGIEDTTRWAVQMILAKLGRIEDAARAAFVANKDNVNEL